jgi:hypothetical protein
MILFVFHRDDDEVRQSVRPKAMVESTPVRVAVLTDDERRALTQQARALPQGATAPTYLGERIQWAEGLHSCAWRDRAELVRVPLEEGALTEAELRAFGQQVSFARETHERYVQRSRQATVLTDDTAHAAGRLEPLRERIRVEQKTLLNAFDLRFANDARGKAMLARIRRGTGDEDLKTDTVELLGLCEHPSHKAWIASLPRGEAQAVKRLGALHGEFLQAQKSERTAGDDVKDLADLRNRAFAQVTATAKRVLTAGKYLSAGDPARRKDYRQYKPAVKKPRAKT